MPAPLLELEGVPRSRGGVGDCGAREGTGIRAGETRRALGGTHAARKARIRLHGGGVPQGHVSWQRGEEKPYSKAAAPRERITWAGRLVRGHLHKGYPALLVTRPLNTQKSRQHPRLGPIILLK